MTKSVRILWAEDSREQFETCSKSLEVFLAEHDIAASFTQAIDGNELFRIMATSTYHLIITDIDMPRFGGLEVIPQIKKTWPGIPIIVVSFHTSDDHVRPVLVDLVSRGIVESYHGVESRLAYCQAALAALDRRPPHILHLSDLHFGKYHAFQSVALEDLTLPVLKLISANGKVDLIIITGDLASVGDEAEFNRSKAYLVFLAAKLEVPLDHVIVVPGNHDIQRSAPEGRRFGNYVDFLISFYGEMDQPASGYQQYPEIFDVTKRFVYPSARNRGQDALYSISVFDHLQTIVIGLNSALSTEAEWAHGRIGPNQFLALGRKLDELTSPRKDYFRVSAFHHNLFVVPSFRDDGAPERVVRNQGFVLHHLIEAKVQLLLHGHTHHSIAYRYTPYFLDSTSANGVPIHVVGTGTLSGSERDPLQPYCHMTSIRCIKADEGRIVGARVSSYKLPDSTLNWKLAGSVDLLFV